MASKTHRMIDNSIWDTCSKSWQKLYWVLIKTFLFWRQTLSDSIITVFTRYVALNQGRVTCSHKKHAEWHRLGWLENERVARETRGHLLVLSILLLSPQGQLILQNVDACLDTGVCGTWRDCAPVSLFAMQWAKQQFIFLTQEKSRFAWLCTLGIRPQCLVRLQT